MGLVFKFFKRIGGGIKKLPRWLVGLCLAFVLWLLVGWMLLPQPLFNDPYATVVFAHDRHLLGARIASDGQWRFPSADTVPEKFREALLLFEDRYFYRHPGFNPFSMVDALADNLKAGEVVRGGSTLTQQVIRLSRKGQSRTLWEKIQELTLAVALELRCSKNEILQYFTDHAPMGGNVVGVEAAAWRYFGHSAHQLSWAEAATLAVLPNAPSLINPGKNRDLLLEKRNNLLWRLYKDGEMDSLTCITARLEPLPEKPIPLPDRAPQLVDFCMTYHQGQRVETEIEFRIQQLVSKLVAVHHQQLTQNGIDNAAVLVISVPDNRVVAYVGNTTPTDAKNHQQAVDMIRAVRSTGSILKPLLYAAMQEDGMLLPNSLVADIPSYYNNYHPTNFDNHYSGAVPVSQALSRSLNVPAIFMVRDYGQARFLHLMKQVGITTFNKPASYYGLSMILGGGEASLWELSGMYAGMARTVINFDKYYGKYTGMEYQPPQLIVNENDYDKEPHPTSDIPLHAASIWLTYKALKEVNRPETEVGWEQFASSKNLAWKTGTSYGFRDAWAIGTTADYVVGVWVGNADGEGRNGLTGTSSAAPIMFDVFRQLDSKSKFYPPYDELFPLAVCHQSGYMAGPYCHEQDTILVTASGLRSSQCPYHQRVFTDSLRQYRLNMNCALPSELFPYDCFVLPPIQEWYYRKDHPLYRGMPPWKAGCSESGEPDRMKFIYPVPGATLLVPRGSDGQLQKVVMQIGHREPSSEVFWHLDDEFVGATKDIHQLALTPKPGDHRLTVVDEAGTSVSVKFTVVTH